MRTQYFSRMRLISGVSLVWPIGFPPGMERRPSKGRPPRRVPETPKRLTTRNPFSEAKLRGFHIAGASKGRKGYPAGVIVFVPVNQGPFYGQRGHLSMP